MNVSKILDSTLLALPTGKIHVQFAVSPKSYLLVEYTHGDEGGIKIYPRYQVTEVKRLKYATDTSAVSEWAYCYMVEQGVVPSPKSYVSMVDASESAIFPLPFAISGLQCGVTIENDAVPTALGGGSISVFLVEG
jgi:hypothetical protein